MVITMTKEKRMSKKFIDMQWAAASKNPYITPEEDLERLKLLYPKKYALAEELVKKNLRKGFEIPEGDNYDDYEDPRDCHLTKDLSREKTCPQRPADADHFFNMVFDSDGKFSHAESGGIHCAERPDGSNNCWDDWHTLLFACFSGIKVRVIRFKHDESLSLEECRIEESRKFNSKNGRNLKVGSAQTFEKQVTDAKTKSNSKKTIVVIDSILNDLKLCPTGKTPNFRKINGIVQLQVSYKELLKEKYSLEETKDITKTTLLVQMESFPVVDVSSYLHEAITWSHNKVNKIPLVNENGEKVNFLQSLKDFFIQNRPAGKNINYFVNTSGNIKNKSKQSIALRILAEWNEWYFNMIGKRRPISKRRAREIFDRDLPDIMIDAYFKEKDEMKTVQCPECNFVFDVKPSNIVE